MVYTYSVFKTKIEPVDKIFVYNIVQDQLVSARRILHSEHVLHTVRSEPQYTSFKIYTTAKCGKLKERLKLKPPREISWVSLSNLLINELVNSCIRIEFFNKGWRRGLGKIYNPMEIIGAVESDDDTLHIYQALRISTGNLNDDLRVLFLDPSFKLEFIKTIDE